MCSICGSHICHPRCPNADEQKLEPIFICLKCEGKIYEGDAYHDLDGEIWCEECVKESKKIA